MSGRSPKPQPATKSHRKPTAPLDIISILHRKITVVQGDTTKRMLSHDAAFRVLASKAIRGDMRAAARFLNECRAAGLFLIPEPVDDHVYSYVIPKEWDDEEWYAMYRQFGPPPWQGERNGLLPLDRMEERARLRGR